MKVVFVSNYFNHHQEPFSNEMAKLCDYYFIATTVMDKERIKQGWKREYYPDYCLQYSERPDYCQNLIDSADVVIYGSAPHSLFMKRIYSNKLTFRCAERQFRVSLSTIKMIKYFFAWHLLYPSSKSFYLLSCSAFAYADFSKEHVFLNKSFKWGYFPEVKYCEIDEILKNKGKSHILWCGRFIDCKHPDIAIEVAKKLKDDGYEFLMSFIGNGLLESELKNKVEEYGLSDNIEFLGAMSPADVRKNMEKAGIFLFTSDKQEGWGAVLNESMNSGCAVVASHAIGAVPYLIKNNENGLIYKSGDIDDLYEKVKFLLDNPDIQEKLGRCSYQTIISEWNSKECATRLLNLIQHLLDNEKYPDLYEHGPCSKAEIIQDDWFLKQSF